MFDKYLRKGKILSIDRVKVIGAQLSYRVVPGDYQLLLNYNLVIREIHDSCNEIPSDGYYFKRFKSLSSLVDNNKYLTCNISTLYYF